MFGYTPTRPPESRPLNGSEKPITGAGLIRAQERVARTLGARGASTATLAESPAELASNAGQRLVTCPACGEQTMIFRLTQRAPLMYAHHLSNDRKCAESGKPYR